MAEKEEKKVDEQSEKKVVDPRFNNYTLIEILHLSYLFRDSFEYCHEKLEIKPDAFERRKTMAKQMLAPGNFTQKWIENHPKEEVRPLYTQFVNYFHNLYEEENYVSFDTKKVDPDKVADFVEETIKCYQSVEDILNAFYTNYKKTNAVVDPDVEKCIIASEDYYRVVANWLFFNEVIRNDNELKKAMKASNNKPSYEVNYNLNILKRLIAGFNFTRQRYTGDKVDIKNMFETTFNAFKALDGTLVKEYQDAHKVQLSEAEIQEMTKKAVEDGAKQSVTCLQTYGPIWQETYTKVVEYMRNNPLNQNTEAKA